MTKEIIIPIQNAYAIEKTKIISMFSSFFSDDFSFDFSDENIELQLGSLDYTIFQHTVNKILSNAVLNNDSKLAVKSLLDTITNIKSYGLKSGKRVYVY